MEPHPVPQDIINVEFKLFGSFTVKQFAKLVAACLAALVVFFLPLHPLIRFPSAGFVLLIGVGIAIVPNFDVWITSYVKSIFVSPRYVWVKSSNKPDVLKENSVIKKDDKSQKDKNLQNKAKVDLDEISLEKLLAARDNSRKSTMLTASERQDAARQDTMNKNMEQVYGTSQGTVVNQNLATEVNQSKVKPTKQKPPVQRSREEYIAQINHLKGELSKIVKDQNYKEKEASIMSQINDLYQDLKMLEVEDDQNISVSRLDSPEANNQNKKVTSFQGQDLGKGQNVFGVVVDKSNKPVTDAKVSFATLNGNVIQTVGVDKSGKFSTSSQLKNGEYVISVESKTKKFPEYKIQITDKKPPMYRLRGR